MSECFDLPTALDTEFFSHKAYICDSSELYNVYNSRIAQLIMLNENVIWVLMFSKKTVALNKIYIASAS